MASLSPKFLDTLRKHLEIGTSLRHINMSDDQKQRVRICMELYNLRKQNPYLDIATYLKNKYNRTYWEIRSDRECLDFICSVLDAGGKNIARAQVRRTYEMAAKIAHDQGDAKNMISAAKHLSDLEKLTEPDQGEDLENSITKLPIVLTQDARKILPGKTFSNERAMDKLRAKWGVKKDVHQDMVDTRAKELLSAGEEVSEDARSMFASDGFDLSSLSQSQLQQLQEALAARMSAPQENYRSDDASDDFDDEEDDV
ncbi:MAG TPA: hypothetical protein O0X78_04370 [Methanocorpusculum sp.]|nr:hypothetical protein [Methanocorpusculum sp.]